MINARFDYGMLADYSPARSYITGVTRIVQDGDTVTHVLDSTPGAGPLNSIPFTYVAPVPVLPRVQSYPLTNAVVPDASSNTFRAGIQQTAVGPAPSGKTRLQTFLESPWAIAAGVLLVGGTSFLLYRMAK